jgi:hypothetical protein
MARYLICTYTTHKTHQIVQISPWLMRKGCCYLELLHRKDFEMQLVKLLQIRKYIPNTVIKIRRLNSGPRYCHNNGEKKAFRMRCIRTKKKKNLKHFFFHPLLQPKGYRHFLCRSCWCCCCHCMASYWQICVVFSDTDIMRKNCHIGEFFEHAELYEIMLPYTQSQVLYFEIFWSNLRETHSQELDPYIMYSLKSTCRFMNNSEEKRPS